jgi:hypothetical protein
MPTYSVGASYLFEISGILRPQHRKDIKVTSALFYGKASLLFSLIDVYCNT